jgi:hypothetical protein
MDRQLSPRQKKKQVFKEFEWLDLIPYSIAFILLLAELSILCEFLQLYNKINY